MSGGGGALGRGTGLPHTWGPSTFPSCHSCLPGSDHRRSVPAPSFSDSGAHPESITSTVPCVPPRQNGPSGTELSQWPLSHAQVVQGLRGGGASMLWGPGNARSVQADLFAPRPRRLVHARYSVFRRPGAEHSPGHHGREEGTGGRAGAAVLTPVVTRTVAAFPEHLRSWCQADAPQSLRCHWMSALHGGG